MPTISENLQRLVSSKNNISDAIIAKGGTVSSGDGFEEFAADIATIPKPTLITKTIIQNGTYNSSSDNADGYSSVVANVPNTYVASDEGKVVSNGALVSQTSDTTTENGVVDTTLISSLTVNVSGRIELQPQQSTKTSMNSVAKPFHYIFADKSWTGLTNFYGENIWTDGKNIYYSSSSNQYVLDKSTSTWSTKTWTGLTSFTGNYIWTDGDNIYYSYGSNQHMLDKSTSTWSTKPWTGLTNFYGNYIWTDGDNIYYSGGSSKQYVLDKLTSTWFTKTWTGWSSFYGEYIWTDGDNVYFSYYNSDTGQAQCFLDRATSRWIRRNWSPMTSFGGNHIWTDGDNIYHSNGSTQYILTLEYDAAYTPSIRTTSCKVKFT